MGLIMLGLTAAGISLARQSMQEMTGQNFPALLPVIVEQQELVIRAGQREIRIDNSTWDDLSRYEKMLNWPDL